MINESVLCVVCRCVLCVVCRCVLCVGVLVCFVLCVVCCFVICVLSEGSTGDETRRTRRTETILKKNILRYSHL